MLFFWPAHFADSVSFFNTGLDFLDTIRLVNYIRSEVKAGNKTPDVSSKSLFADDVYMKPVLEDDALLYSLDDITDEPLSENDGSQQADKRVLELEEELSRLRSQFAEYRIAVQKSMEDQIDKENDRPSSTDKTSARHNEAESDYFTSYSYNGTALDFMSREIWC